MSELAVCPKCDGEGFLMNRGQQVAAGIISLGLFPLLDAVFSNSAKDSEFSRRCNVCGGHGAIRTPSTLKRQP